MFSKVIENYPYKNVFVSKLTCYLDLRGLRNERGITLSYEQTLKIIPV